MSSRIGKCQLCMALLLASEAVFFTFLILAYLYFRGAVSSGPTASGSLDPRVTGIYTALLIASSLTIWVAGRKLKARNTSPFRLWLLATVLLGAGFLFGQGREYVRLLQDHIAVDRNLFATSFFTLTGFHGLHVLTGVSALSTMLGIAYTTRAGRDAMGVKETAAFESISLYWHFVDAVWIVIFSIVYLGGVS